MNKSYLSLIAIALSALTLSGCATSLNENAHNIQIVSSNFDTSGCQFKGEVTGSQGNWLTGGYTPTDNLIIGARNAMQNKAYRLGANIITLQSVSNSQSSESSGTTNSTSIGNAYFCQNVN